MTQLLKLIFIILLVSPFASSYAAEISPVPTPSWVIDHNVDSDYTIPQDEISSGVYYLLVDSQTNVPRDDDSSSYFRIIQNIVNPTGVKKSSQIDLSYDPNYQQIKLHSITILRDGRTIDKIDTAKISILQQEKELENLIYNGRESINIVLDDIRVGD